MDFIRIMTGNLQLVGKIFRGIVILALKASTAHNSETIYLLRM